ncbi:hypothetical protein E2I14_11935 [Sapientia aquatica]|uniref:Uncharacterized protein n=1 Tax=Sapientia aquatica TaxID=1549640 RepID=A0A4R5W168_9BURK|nr:hypothetical protein E2I14_11935 [Sapientia aquatica]
MQQFDYVIVGGGSTGCLLASRLSEPPSVRVGLLEASEPDDSNFIKLTQKKGQHCHAELASIRANLHRTTLTAISHTLITAIEFASLDIASITVKQDGQLPQLRAKKEVIVSSGTYFSLQLSAMSIGKTLSQPNNNSNANAALILSPSLTSSKPEHTSTGLNQVDALNC